MSKATMAATIAALVFAGTLYAHHSSSMFQIDAEVWVKGTVVSYEPVSPHAMFVLEEQKQNGQVRQWTVEGPWAGRLERYAVADDFLKPGDVIEVCGFYLKDSVVTQKPAHVPEGLSPQFIHGRMIVLPDGQRWMWGPYGLLQNCIDPSEWDTIARGSWPLPSL